MHVLSRVLFPYSRCWQSSNLLFVFLRLCLLIMKRYESIFLDLINISLNDGYDCIRERMKNQEKSDQTFSCRPLSDNGCSRPRNVEKTSQFLNDSVVSNDASERFKSERRILFHIAASFSSMNNSQCIFWSGCEWSHTFWKN